MKKIIVLTLILFSLIPMANVFASTNRTDLPNNYRNGLLDIDGILESTNAPISFYDNSLSTSTDLNTSRTFYFKVPVNIDGFYAHTGSVYHTSRLRITFYNHLGSNVGSHLLNNLQRGYIDFEADNVMSISLSKVNQNSLSIHQVEFFGSYDLDHVDLPTNIDNLTTSKDHSSITLNYDLPSFDNFSHIKIYQDDTLIQDNYTESSITVEGLNPSQSYNYKVVTVDESGNESEGVTVNVTTDPLPVLEEVTEVVAEAEHDRVDISWKLPETEAFEHVNIYRKGLNTETETTSLFDFLKPMTVYASEEYDPIFETNGTYFNDLTVEENSSYEYKLTTEYEGLESDGVIVQATTAIAPAPTIVGDNYEQQDNGDYLVSWDQPETGEVRVLVDGQVYETVPGEDRQFTIPAADMKYSAFGEPLVGIQPVGSNGQEGEPIQAGGTNLPFGVSQLIQTTSGLMMLIGSFLLLGLAFLFAPKVIRLIKSSLKTKTGSGSQASIDERYQERGKKQVERSSNIGTCREPRQGRTVTRQPRQGRA